MFCVLVFSCTILSVSQGLDLDDSKDSMGLDSSVTISHHLEHFHCDFSPFFLRFWGILSDSLY